MFQALKVARAFGGSVQNVLFFEAFLKQLQFLIVLDWIKEYVFFDGLLNQQLINDLLVSNFSHDLNGKHHESKSHDGQGEFPSILANFAHFHDDDSEMRLNQSFIAHFSALASS